MAMYVKQIGTGFSIQERATKDGKSYCTLAIAFNTMKKGKDGKITKEAEDAFFINAIAFGKSAAMLIENKNDKGGFFGRFTIQATVSKDEDGKSNDHFKVIKVETVTKNVVETVVAEEATLDDDTE